MIHLAPLARLLSVLLLVSALAACGGDTTEHADPAGGGTHADDGGHDHEQGPHGGAIAVVGDEVAHLEALHDEDAGQVTVYVLGEDNAVVALDQPPLLNLVTDEGSRQVKAVAVGEAWLFEDAALLGEPEKARFRLVIAGKTYQPDMPCSHEHGADGEHGDEHGGHGPHDGVRITFADGLGHLELKLHDDKGDLELWLTKDDQGTTPYDLPLDALITVTFTDHGGRKVALAVRNRERNEDEDGKANLREGKTNYFIFPGDTGVDASWLTGAEFVSQVIVTIAADGKTFTTQPFTLRPHTHGAGDHEH